jgi:SAM-dependent methyltransferase
MSELFATSGLPIHFSRRRLLAAAALLPAASVFAQTDRPTEEVPYVVTPPLIVERMLQLADVTATDRLADLGSGDGRIVIAAARKGAFARGFEIDGALVALSTRYAERAGVINRTEFVNKDIFDVNYAEYSVVTMYLLPEFNLKLRPKLLQELKPGARIVSHEWDMGEWEPDETLTVRAPTKPLGNDKAHRVHLWVVPADIDGRWRLRSDGLGAAVEFAISQQFQKLDVTASRGTVRAAALRGRALTMLWNDGTRNWRLAGELDRDRLRGLVGGVAEENPRNSWSAEKIR